jgi:hypothetical protein
MKADPFQYSSTERYLRLYAESFPMDEYKITYINKGFETRSNRWLQLATILFIVYLGRSRQSNGGFKFKKAMISFLEDPGQLY